MDGWMDYPPCLFCTRQSKRSIVQQICTSFIITLSHVSFFFSARPELLHHEWVGALYCILRSIQEPCTVYVPMDLSPGTPASR